MKNFPIKQSSLLFERLQQRQKITAIIRDDLHAAEFLEVETPLLVKNTSPDAYIDSMQVGEHYLITSTEYQIKRLIALGFPRIFTLCKNFRAHDRGQYHSPEFTMLEWGRAFESLSAIEADVLRFTRKAFAALYPGQSSLVFDGHHIDFMNGMWDKMTVREAFSKYLGMNNLKDFSLENICREAKKTGISLPQDFQKDQSLAISYLLDTLQSYLGNEKPVFLNEWPAFLTSSAPINANDPFVVERSELYIGGIEIANGFPFLTDPQIQKTLFESQQTRRKELGKPTVLLDEKYISSLKSLPKGAGMALGMDRLVMVLIGGERLSDAMAFDWDDL